MQHPTHTDFLWNWFVIVWERLGLVAHPDHYTVTLWGSHPDAGNDDANTGTEFATLEEAHAEFYRILDTGAGRVLLATPQSRGYNAGWAFIELTGPAARCIEPNPDQRAVRRVKLEAERSDREWQRERATQAGMAFGCDGYNDEMGY